MHKPDEPTPLGLYAVKVWIAVAIAASMIVLLFTLWHGLEILLIIFAGLLLGLFLLAPATWLAAHSFLSRRWAMAAVLLAIIVLVSVFGLTLATNLQSQFQQLLEVLPDSLSELKTQIRDWPLGSAIVSQFEQSQGNGNVLGQWASRISSLLSSTVGALVTFFFIIVLALFIAFEPDTYRHGFLLLVPPGRRPLAEDLLLQVHHRLNWWILGRLLSMSVVGLATALGLWLIGMPAYLSLALLAALLVFIPNLGPLLAAVPALLVALSEGLFLPVAALYLLLQSIESYLITPMIDRQSVKLPPALLLSMQVSLGLLAGTMGLLLAAPLTVLAMVVIKRLYVDRWRPAPR